MESYIVPFDRIKLLLSCILYLMLFLLMPAICLYVRLDPLMIFFLLTVCWFMIKAAIRNVKRLIKKTPICIVNDNGISIYSLSDKSYTVKWEDIEKVMVKEKHHCVQFILFGEHIKHASGVYMIHINYPFIPKKLAYRKQEMIACFVKHSKPVQMIKT